jgi:hypothetical protein
VPFFVGRNRAIGPRFVVLIEGLVVVECAGCDKGFVVCEVAGIWTVWKLMETGGIWWNLLEIF